jgi:superfamily I DNA/RNA helicase
VAECRGGVQESDAFLLAEWDAVIDFWGVRERASYLAIERRGRGQRLDRAGREGLWPVFASMRAELDAKGRMTAADLCESAALVLSDRAETPFDYLLLDEAQDLGPRELAFAIQVASRGGAGLFFAGDAGQRVFKYPFPWASVGVDIRGRSRHLRIAYRTSAEIRRFAARILPEDVEDEGPRSTGATFSGSDPEVIAMANAAEERDVVAAWVADRLAEGLMPSDMAILARTADRAATASSGLATQPVWDMAVNRIAVGTLADAKGLEFRAVAIAGCEDGLVPLTAALRADPDPEAQEIALMRERNLLYVGCTRARETLLLTHIGPLTRFLRESSTLRRC